MKGPSARVVGRPTGAERQNPVRDSPARGHDTDEVDYADARMWTARDAGSASAPARESGRRTKPPPPAIPSELRIRPERRRPRRSPTAGL